MTNNIRWEKHSHIVTRMLRLFSIAFFLTVEANCLIPLFGRMKEVRPVKMKTSAEDKASMC